MSFNTLLSTEVDSIGAAGRRGAEQGGLHGLGGGLEGGVVGHQHLALAAGRGGGHQVPQGGVVDAGEMGEVLRVSPGKLVKDDYLP